MIDSNIIPNNDTAPLSSAAISDLLQYDDEINAARQQYCCHSGKPLNQVAIDTVNDLITIHGRTTAIKILLTQQSQVSLEWIWLNDDGLANLALNRTKEYFIYCTSKLLQDVTLHNELMRLHEGAEAWRNLQQVSDDILQPVNELMRRLLGGWKRKKLNSRLAKLKRTKVNLITFNLDSIVHYQKELEKLIQDLYAKQKRNQAMQEGMTNFRLQKMITALSSMELSIGREFNDFDLIDGKSADSVDVIVGRAYGNKDKKQKAKQKYATTPIKHKGGGFKLKLGGGK